MAKIPCKGTKLQQSIATVLTDVAQVISLDVSGSESQTFDATSLDSATFREHMPTGFTEPGSVDGELFYDPALAGHQAMTDVLAAPAVTEWKIIFADTGATEMGFSGGGFTFGISASTDDGLRGSFSIKITGDPGWPS